ncbi:LOW QUALITY PROTEIN: natterin-3-like [Anabas testudineus]|uniref:LOW QUALITY PROTEIN: natterin-3-like n=1 Tax=Anabas testudineus TaxID=64144 RepID=UPI000E46449F|nr:LOW QUALITY PROTEIN: natterin-3-like [Anabas testudineus]
MMKIGNTNLEWQPWSGSLPNGAVSIYNDYAKRTDYVCKSGSEAGFYNPSMGPNCHYPYNEKEHLTPNFEILVNKDNIEFLEWKNGSYGSVPPNSVSTCSGTRITYVGRNKYGLGKVDPRNTAFFLPREGKEHWYKHYQVLTYDTEIYSEQISDVKFKIDGAQILKNPPQTIRDSTVTNNQCSPVTETVTLSTTSQVEQSWNINFSITDDVKTSISAQIPLITSAGIELGLQTTFQYTKGTTQTESTTHSVNVECTVPPNHSCNVRMVVYRYEGNIPFTARLTRTYRNGQTKWASISGTFKGVQIGNVQAVVDRCEPIPNAKPCPLK